MVEDLRAPESYIRYLAAKKTVDDRALNHHVWTSLTRALPVATPVSPLRVLEVGAGIGSMIERLVERSLLTQAIFTALDLRPEHSAEAKRRLPHYAAEHGLEWSDLPDGRQLLHGPARRIVIDLQTIDVVDFLARRDGSQNWDLLVAHACLDELDVPRILPRMLACLRPGGLAYFTINFDGVTILEPVIEPALDAWIEALYHQTMEYSRIAGRAREGSRTGRHLIGYLHQLGMDVLAAGSSDWVVLAGPHGYSADEGYFLHFIVDTILRALDGHPALDEKSLTEWVTERHAQIERGELVYIAHQLDVLAQAPT